MGTAPPATGIMLGCGVDCGYAAPGYPPTREVVAERERFGCVGGGILDVECAERCPVGEWGKEGRGRWKLLVAVSAEDHGAYCNGPVKGRAYFAQHFEHGCEGSRCL